MKRPAAFALVASALLSAGARADSAVSYPVEQANTMQIRLSVEGGTLTASLVDSETTRDFVSLLPLTLTLNDLFGREKFARLPRAISRGGERRRTYDLGEMVYWSPGPDVAIFYRHDGQAIPPPGIIVIGRITSGLDLLEVPGPVEVTVERAP
jgi:hypothetical protein